MHERWGGGFKSPQRSGWLVMMLTQSGTTVAPLRYQPGCLDAPLQGRWPSHSTTEKCVCTCALKYAPFSHSFTI